MAALALVRVNRVDVADREVRKERRRGVLPVIAVGNAYFRSAGAPFRMFARVGPWIAHEQRMFRELHGLAVRRDGRAIVMPRLPGRDLLTIARAGDDLAEPLFHLGRALGGLHRRGLSHGDLNLGNAIVDGSTARLVDFDAAHVDAVPTAHRAADDVLGLALDLFARGGPDPEREFARFVEGLAPERAVTDAFERSSRARGVLAQTLLRARGHGMSESELERAVTSASTGLRRWSIRSPTASTPHEAHPPAPRS